MITNPDDKEYRDNMEPAMEDLAIALWGIKSEEGPALGSDAKIVEVAARKIFLMRKIILASGFSEKLLQDILNDA
jgi:hypothetical protein